MKKLHPQKWEEQVKGLKRLGSGAYGTVYAIGNRAVKISPTEREAKLCRLLAGKKLPNVVRVHSVQTLECSYGKRWAIYMERLNRHPKLNANGVHDILHKDARLKKSVDRGLQALRDLGWDHTDLHGGNVLFGPNGGAKIIDFGLVYPLRPKKAKPQPPPVPADADVQPLKGCMCSDCQWRREVLVKRRGRIEVWSPLEPAEPRPLAAEPAVAGVWNPNRLKLPGYKVTDELFAALKKMQY